MKLQTKVTLSESQKAQIVARGEVLQTVYTFEMTAKYAATFSRLHDSYYVAYAVENDHIEIRNLEKLLVQSGGHHISNDFSDAVASGKLTDGSNCDILMQEIEKLLDDRDTATQAAKAEEEAQAKKDATREESEQGKRAAEAAEHDRQLAESNAKEMKKAAARKAKHEAEKAEKVVWIKAHGSERLQKGIAAGYHCQKIYVAERGKIDLGSEYILDYDENIATKDRSCPTLEALNEAERLTESGIEARVKWLPGGTGTVDEDGYYDSEPSGCEAVEAILLGSYFYKEF